MVKTRRSSSANNLQSLETSFAQLGANYGRRGPLSRSRPASPQKKKAKIEERRVSQCVEQKSPRPGPSSRLQKGDAPRKKSKYNAAELAKVRSSFLAGHSLTVHRSGFRGPRSVMNSEKSKFHALKKNSFNAF